MTNTSSRFLSEIATVYVSFLLKDHKIRSALSDSLTQGSALPPYREAALPPAKLSAHQDCADDICPTKHYSLHAPAETWTWKPQPATVPHQA